MAEDCGVPISPTAIAAGKYQDPRGGLNPAGRAHFGVAKGVTNYTAASRTDKGRWVAWALRFTGTPQRLTDDKGRPTRYALMFRAWGEPVPTTVAAVRAVHAKAMTRSAALKAADAAHALPSRPGGPPPGREAGASTGCADCPQRSFARIEALLEHMASRHLDHPASAEAANRVPAGAEHLDPDTAANVPDNPKLYALVRALTKAKFRVYPSAYANAWLVAEYKRRGGTYTSTAATSTAATSTAATSTAARSNGGLTQWFREDWVDISRPKPGGGFAACGRPTEAMTAADYRRAYPKCVPASVAARMTPAQRRSAITRKRRDGLPSNGTPNPVATQRAEADSGQVCPAGDCTRVFRSDTALARHTAAVHDPAPDAPAPDAMAQEG